MKLPVLYSGQTMTVARALHPLTMKISWKKDGLSTATLTLLPDEGGIGVNSWIRVYAPNGETAVFYVRNKKIDYVSGIETLELEHGFGLLEQMVVFGEFKSQAMGGTSSTVPIVTAIRFALSKQSTVLWQMDTSDCDPTDAQGWKISDQDILSALNGFVDSICDVHWEFDQSSLPWKLKLKNDPTEPTMELRQNRNLSTIQVTMDCTKMYTRCYPVGKNEIHIDSVNSGVSYLDENTATYGVIAEIITDSTIKDKNLLKAWGQKQLRRNSKPYTTITVSGLELSEATGEPMDKLYVNRMCRIPLPDRGVVLKEMIVSLEWKDAVSDETSVTVTLGQEKRTIASVMNESGGGGGGGGTKKDEPDKDLGDLTEWKETVTQSDIYINSDDIWAVCGTYDITYTTIIDPETGQPKTIKTLAMMDGSNLTMTHDGLTFGVYDSYSLTAGIIVDKINGGTVKIQAAKIELSGYTTVSQLNAAVAQIQTAISSEVNTSSLESVTGTINQLTVPYTFKVLGHTTSWRSVTIDGTTYNLLGY